MDPWTIELVVVRDGSHFPAERKALSRDVDSGLLIRLRRGVYVPSGVYPDDAEGRHVLAMRAFAAVHDGPVVFSHWSAALVLGLPVDRTRLGRVHVTVPGTDAGGPTGVTVHSHRLDPAEILPVQGVLVTTAARTVVDLAGSSPFGLGVTVADAALHAGVEREALEAAWAATWPRRASTRTEQVVAFAHAGSESAAESETRCSMFRLGVACPELQVTVLDAEGFAGRPDVLFRARRVPGECDGARKYLDPRLAPEGAGRAVYEEKLREDRLRRCLDGFARWSWREARDPQLLRPIVARAGVHPSGARFEDYRDAARAWRPGSRYRG